MEVFRRVVEEGAFASAARKLQLSPGSVSKHVAALEASLDTRLLHRTTRSIGLTAAGQAYYDRLCVVLDDLASLERDVRGDATALSGTLRVAVPMSLGLAAIAPVVAEFLERHPKVHLDLALNDRRVDLVEDGIDLALRVAETLPDSTLVARRLAPMPRVLVGSPDYLSRRGTPQHPRDLEQHDCIRYSRLDAPDVWPLQRDDETVRAHVRGSLSADNSLALIAALRSGLGLALVPTFTASEALADGSLVQVLADWSPPPRWIYGVYPTRRQLSAKVRAFLDFVADALDKGPPPPQ